MSISTSQLPGNDAGELHAQQRLAFKLHARVFAASMVLIFVVNLVLNAAAGLLGEWSAWWSGWALLGWGLGVAVHGLVVRMAWPETSTSS